MTIEEPTKAAAQRFENLDALRGVCALLVALYHFRANGLLTTNALVRNAYLFVDYFFVLSGFVIAFSYGDRLLKNQISLGRFLGLRLGRIYPLHAAMLAAFVLLQLLLLHPIGAVASLTDREPFSGPYSAVSLVHNVLLLHSFGVDPGLTWNTPSWSIAAEVWCYALFGTMLAARPKRSVILAAIFSAAAFCWLIVTRHSIEVASDVGFVRCVYGFGLGFLTFQLFRRRPSQSNTALELGIVGAIAAFVSLASGRWTFAAPPLFAASIYFLAGGKGLVSKLLKRPAFQFLGLVSYSIYMIHYFVEERFIDILRLLAPGLTSKHADGFVLNVDRWLVDLVTLGVLALIVAGSYVSYRLIEQPGREITRKWLGPPTSAKRAALD